MVVEGKVKEEGGGRRRDRVVLGNEKDQGEGHGLPLEEVPDVEAGSNASNCTLLVHGG